MQSKITYSVSKLLFLHDCVVIPGFGGLVSRNSPAKINFASGSVSPPSKSVIFNKNLVSNDGLLANFLTKEYAFSYSEANEEISQFVREFNLNLHSNHRVEISQIGNFYLDLEKNIQFDADPVLNFLPESFGLHPINLNRIEIEYTSEKGKTDRYQLSGLTTSGLLRKKTFRVASAVGSICLLIGFMIAVSLIPKNSFLAGLNPFIKSTPLKYSGKKYPGFLETSKEFDEKNLIDLKENGTGTLSLNREDQIVFVYVRDENKSDSNGLENEILNRKNPYSPPELSKPFEIIIGCFREKGNANRMMRNALSNRFPARVIGKNDKNLYVVSAGGYSGLQTAADNLEKVRGKYSDAWVLKK